MSAAGFQIARCVWAVAIVAPNTALRHRFDGSFYRELMLACSSVTHNANRLQTE